MTALEAAEQELVRRYRAADAAGDWQERCVLSPLVDVADFTKRIGDNRHSTHYRAEKAGALVRSAINVQHQTLLAYACWPEGNDQERRLDEAFDLLRAVTSAMIGAGWATAKGPVYCSTVSEVRSAVSDLRAWADRLAEIALPDEDD